MYDPLSHWFYHILWLAFRRRVVQLMPIALRHAMSSLTEKLQQESLQAKGKSEFYQYIANISYYTHTNTCTTFCMVCARCAISIIGNIIIFFDFINTSQNLNESLYLMFRWKRFTVLWPSSIQRHLFACSWPCLPTLLLTPAGLYLNSMENNF